MTDRSMRKPAPAEVGETLAPNAAIAALERELKREREDLEYKAKKIREIEADLQRFIGSYDKTLAEIDMITAALAKLRAGED